MSASLQYTVLNIIASNEHKQILNITRLNAAVDFFYNEQQRQQKKLNERKQLNERNAAKLY